MFAQLPYLERYQQQQIVLPKNLAKKNPQLGDVFTGIATIIATAGTVGINAYTAIENLDMAKEQNELMITLATKKADLEAEVVKSQQRLLEVQTQGIEGRQNIDLEIAQAEADAAKKRLARLEEVEIMQTELTKLGLQIDATKLMAQLEELKTSSSSTGTTTQATQETQTVATTSTTVEATNTNSNTTTTSFVFELGTWLKAAGVLAVLLLLIKLVKGNKT